MKILQVVHQFLPEYVGGTEVYVDNLSRALIDRGHQVRVLAGSSDNSEREWQGITVNTVPGGLRGRRGAVGNFFTAFGNPEVERAFEVLCQEYAPDVVHFHHLVGLSSRLISIARSMGLPTAFTLHDYWFMCPNGQLITERQKVCGGPILGLNCSACAAHRLGLASLAPLSVVAAPLFIKRQWTMREAVSTADVVIAPSKFVGSLADKNGIPTEKIVYINHGVEVGLVHRRPAEDGAVRLAYLGSIAPVKGVHVLVDAVKLLDQNRVGLRIYGDCSTFPEYARELENGAKGTNVRFMGPVAREFISQALSEVDVIVVPSMWYENAPLVVQEAFAAGVPVVASKTGALEEWVQNGVNGLHFAMGNAPDLAEKLQRLLDEPALLAQLRAGVPSVPSLSQHVEEIEKVYSGIIAKKVAGESSDHRY